MTPLALEATTIRVFHHGDEIAAFARNDLGRLAAHWRAQLVPIVYAVRGWQGGPHLDLTVWDRDPSRLGSGRRGTSACARYCRASRHAKSTPTRTASSPAA